MRLSALAAFAIMCAPALASAHMGSTKYVFVEPSEQGARVRLELDPIDVAYELDLDDPDAPDLAAIEARGTEVGAWLVRAVRMRSAGGACIAEPSDPSIVARGGAIRGGRAVRVDLEFTCPSRQNLVLHDDAVFGGDPQHEAIVRTSGAGDQVRATILRRGRQDLRVGEIPSLGDTVVRFLYEGAFHLATGYDHLLFLLSLLLVAGQVAAKKGVKIAARDVAMIVTAFTLGHSVTLIAAALDVVSLPSRLVESAIAASIVVVAALNLRKENASKGIPWIAFAFGLVHGFGFSSVLRELVLPTSDRIVALLSFNVGIELAQLAFVAIAIFPLAWAGKQRWYEPAILRGGSVIVAAVAGFWFVQRAFAL
jgi:hypothetical protein